MFKTLFTIVAMAAAGLMLSIQSDAQIKRSFGSSNSHYLQMIRRAKQEGSRLDPETARRVRDGYEGGTEVPAAAGDAIVGTWNCSIPQSNGGAPPFEALQTFGADGTFVETSSLLGMGGEGPAHGAWERSRNGYILSFELFVFDPESGMSVGRVRVRNFIRMLGRDAFQSDTAVDFIELDGAVIENIDGGPFYGTRLKARGI